MRTAGMKDFRFVLRKSGKADTNPREKTNDPTPRSICLKLFQQEATVCDVERDVTNQRRSPSFGFGEFPRKDFEIDRQDADNRHQHHMSSIYCDECSG
jgi:hypothetical protein